MPATTLAAPASRRQPKPSLSQIDPSSAANNTDVSRSPAAPDYHPHDKRNALEEDQPGDVAYRVAGRARPGTVDQRIHGDDACVGERPVGSGSRMIASLNKSDADDTERDQRYADRHLRAGQLPQHDGAQDRDQQRRRSAHQRVGKGQV